MCMYATSAPLSLTSAPFSWHREAHANPQVHTAGKPKQEVQNRKSATTDPLSSEHHTQHTPIH